MKKLEPSNNIEDKEEYSFNWIGKRKSIEEANSPINKILYPCKQESKNWDMTNNIYIEADNLDGLKLLKNNYLNKIKLIYIDPPYNTGKSFIYKDNFIDQNKKTQSKTSNRQQAHCNWCSMIFSRLIIAKSLLTEDGAIFISIDDNEISNLRKMCDEIFNEDNFVGCIARCTGTTTGQDSNKIGSSFDYLLCYRKSNKFSLEGIPLTSSDLSRFTEVDKVGRYSCLQLRKTGNADRREDRPFMYYPITAPDGTQIYPKGPSGYESRWRVAQNTYQNLLENNMIIWKNNREGILTPYVKYYAEGRTKQVSNLWNEIDGNKKGSLELKELLGAKIFDSPKPTDLIKKILKISKTKNSIILDFFSGSATTAHAVMQLNAEDGGNRQFIMIQLPEEINKKTEAFKNGYENISDIGKERIRRAGEKIIKETGKTDLDVGFCVYKLK